MSEKWKQADIDKLLQKTHVKKKTHSKIDLKPISANALTEVINGNVPSKSNCYKIVAFNGHSSLAKTKAMKEYEDRFYMQCKSRNAMIAGYFELHLKVFYPTQKSDLDNSLKVILDCLQKTKTIVNDNKCVKIIAEKFLDKLNPRIEFEIKIV